jgi:transposase
MNDNNLFASNTLPALPSEVQLEHQILSKSHDLIFSKLSKLGIILNELDIDDLYLSARAAAMRCYNQNCNNPKRNKAYLAKNWQRLIDNVLEHQIEKILIQYQEFLAAQAYSSQRPGNN